MEQVCIRECMWAYLCFYMCMCLSVCLYAFVDESADIYMSTCILLFEIRTYCDITAHRQVWRKLFGRAPTSAEYRYVLLTL